MYERKLLRVYTQNIDSLECQMKTGPRGSLRLEDKTIYLHGTIQKYRCTMVDNHTGLCSPDILTAWKRGEKYKCLECFPYNQFGRRISTGFLIPDIDLYHSIPPKSRTENIKDFMTTDIPIADCLIVIGTSLRKEVIGARNLVICSSESVKRTGGKCFWINLTNPPKELASLFDYCLIGAADDVLLKLYSFWMPDLKPLQVKPYKTPTIMKTRRIPKVSYSGMESTRRSRGELRAKSRISNRRINKMI